MTGHPWLRLRICENLSLWAQTSRILSNFGERHRCLHTNTCPRVCTHEQVFCCLEVSGHFKPALWIALFVLVSLMTVQSFSKFTAFDALASSYCSECSFSSSQHRMRPCNPRVPSTCRLLVVFSGLVHLSTILSTSRPVP